MLRVNGLFGHIQRNNAKSLLLLASFLLLFELLHIMSVMTPVLDTRHVQQAIGAVANVFTHQAPAPEAQPVTEAEANRRDLIDSPYMQAMRRNMWWQALVLGVIWFAVGWLIYKYALQATTGARPVERRQEPRLCNLVENLAIQAGLPCPKIQVMETSARNAYSASFSPASASIAVTRGLLQSLNDSELKAVLAHEIVHIRNRDIRLMAINSIFCGIVFGAAWRMLQTGVKRGLFLLALIPPFSAYALPFVLWIIAVVIFGAWMARVGVSRAREFIADAGAVELTQDPQALASALRRIEGRETVEGADYSVQAMMFSTAAVGPFATHPSPRERIAALHSILPTLTPDEAVARAAPRDQRLTWAAIRTTADSMPKWLSRHVVIIPVAALTFVANLAVGAAVDPDFAGANLALRTGGLLGKAMPVFIGRGFAPVSNPAQESALEQATSAAAYYGLPMDSRALQVYAARMTRARTRIASCFPLGNADPYESGHGQFQYVPTDDAYMKTRALLDGNETIYHAWQYKTAMHFAVNDCRNNGCTGERLNFYKSTLGSYMIHKMALVREYDGRYGPMGASFAQNYFRDRRDDEIIADVRARASSGQIDPHDFPFSYDAIRMTLERPAEDFLPCHRKGEWRNGLGEQLPVNPRGASEWD